MKVSQDRIRAAEFKAGPDSLNHLYLNSSDGTPVRLSTLAQMVEQPAMLAITRSSQLPAVTVSFNLARSASLGEAVDQIKRVEQEIGLPISIDTSFQGAAKAFQTMGALVQAGYGDWTVSIDHELTSTYPCVAGFNPDPASKAIVLTGRATGG